MKERKLVPLVSLTEYVVVTERIKEYRDEIKMQITVSADRVMDMFEELDMIFQKILNRGRSGDDLNELRAKYTKLYGKKPFTGWTKEQILSRIKGHEGYTGE